jgi:tetratricopeptide (TPR) repeat protein
MDKELTSLEIPHSISFFNGKHEWPPVEEFKEALLWLQIEAMREKLCPVNSGILNWFAHSSDSIAGNLVKSGKMVMGANTLQKAISALKGLSNVDELEKNLHTIMAANEYLTEVKNEESLAGLEEKLKSEYNNAMLTKDDKWWANELKVINDRCNSEKDPLKLGMFNRLKGFFGIMAYSYTSRAAHAADIKESERMIAIYSLIEPENPDWMYYQALLYDKLGKTQKAIEELKLSISKGLGDRPRIARDFSSEVKKAVE